MLEQFLGLPGAAACAQLQIQLSGRQGHAQQHGPEHNKRFQMIAVHVVGVRQGWHSHAGPGSGPVTFSVAIYSTRRLNQPMTLVRFGKINNSVVAKRMSPA